MFGILKNLRLQISLHKTKMGALKNAFHFLGVDFTVTRIPQSKIQVVTVDLHPRSCRRALDKVTALRLNAVHPAHIQRYLSRWAIWWKSVVNIERMVLIYQWVCFVGRFQSGTLWLGHGLLLGSLYYNLPFDDI
jgi:hypothetical protein